LVSQLQGIPCAHCNRPEALNWVIKHRETPSATPIEAVICITGVVGWWLEEVEFKKCASRWVNRDHGKLPTIQQTVSRNLYASDRFQQATRMERESLAQEAIFELEVGEGIKSIEQLIPMSVKPGEAALRRGVVNKLDTSNLKALDVYNMAAWNGDRRGTQLVPGEEFNFLSAQEVRCMANGKRYDAFAFELENGQGWVIDFNPDEPDVQNIRVCSRFSFNAYIFASLPHHLCSSAHPLSPTTRLCVECLPLTKFPIHQNTL
jgi:hypothetical protein